METLGLRHRRHYDTRRTFVSLGLAGGGRKDVLRWITHSPGDVFDGYTTLPWETLCEAVAAIRVEPPPRSRGCAGSRAERVQQDRYTART